MSLRFLSLRISLRCYYRYHPLYSVRSKAPTAEKAAVRGFPPFPSEICIRDEKHRRLAQWGIIPSDTENEISIISFWGKNAPERALSAVP
jgi:hypothetical protein